MVISLMSAMTIQENETMVDTYSNNKETGYGFIVYLMRGKHIHTQIVSTLPRVPYSSRDEAQKAGEDLVKAVREVDLNLE